jgi:hypothetical protein
MASSTSAPRPFPAQTIDVTSRYGLGRRRSGGGGAPTPGPLASSGEQVWTAGATGHHLRAQRRGGSARDVHPHVGSHVKHDRAARSTRHSGNQSERGGRRRIAAREGDRGVFLRRACPSGIHMQRPRGLRCLTTFGCRAHGYSLWVPYQWATQEAQLCRCASTKGTLFQRRCPSGATWNAPCRGGGEIAAGSWPGATAPPVARVPVVAETFRRFQTEILQFGQQREMTYFHFSK